MEEVVENDTFRLHCSVVHLTYKHHIPIEPLLAHIQGIAGNCIYYSIVHENGEADDNFPYAHTHALFKFGRKLDTRNPRFFDFRFEVDGTEEVVHPNIKRVLSKRHESTVYHTYHNKGPVAIKQGGNPPALPATQAEKVIKESNSIYEACEKLGIGPKTVTDVRTLWDSKRRKKLHVHRYPNTVWSLEHPIDFKVLYVWGPSGFGKTQWGLAAFKCPLLVRQLDDLRDLCEEHDGIVFDDMYFSHRPVSECIHLLDWDEESSIYARYSNILIPAETRKIFITNKPLEDCFPSSDEMTFAAIKRRICKIIHVVGKTYLG